MEKLRLKYRLEPTKKIDFLFSEYEFQIYNMDDKFRDENLMESKKAYHTKNGYSIYSLHNPGISLESKNIWLRGSQKEFDDSTIIFIATENEIQEIKEALKEWSIKWFNKKTKKKNDKNC